MNLEDAICKIFKFNLTQFSQDYASFRQFADANISVDSLPARGAIFHAAYPLDPTHSVFIMSRMFRITECHYFQPVQLPRTMEKFIKAYQAVEINRLNMALPEKLETGFHYTKAWSDRRAFNVDVTSTKDEKGVYHVTTLVGVTHYQTRVVFHYKTEAAPVIEDYLRTLSGMLKNQEIIRDLEGVANKYYSQIKGASL